jgi:hypothetical protein
MAAFVIKRTSFGATANRGRKATMNDAAMTKVIAAYREVYGAEFTDDEVTDKIFDSLLIGLASAGDKDAKIKAAKTASDAVAPISSVITSDNT